MSSQMTGLYAAIFFYISRRSLRSPSLSSGSDGLPEASNDQLARSVKMAALKMGAFPTAYAITV